MNRKNKNCQGKTLAFFVSIFFTNDTICYTYSMISIQKILTSCVLFTLLCTDYMPVVLAEEAFHSLDELPSMASAPIESTDNLSDLIVEKQVYEHVVKNETPEAIIPEELIVSASTLLEEREMYVAGRVSEDILTPSMTPGRSVPVLHPVRSSQHRQDSCSIRAYSISQIYQTQRRKRRRKNTRKR